MKTHEATSNDVAAQLLKFVELGVSEAIKANAKQSNKAGGSGGGGGGGGESKTGGGRSGTESKSGGGV
jgi:hypothetical protein